MKISDYSYFLPQSLIAKVPPIVRGSSRLLVVDRQTGNIQDRLYTDIVDYLWDNQLYVDDNALSVNPSLSSNENEFPLVNPDGMVSTV